MNWSKTLLLTVASLCVTKSTFADGRWYSDHNEWLAAMQVVTGTADYNNLKFGGLSTDTLTENGITTSTVSAIGLPDAMLWGVGASLDGSNYFNSIPTGQISTRDPGPLKFTFAGNAFGGRFLATNTPDVPYYGASSVPLYFHTSDGSAYTQYTLAGSAPYTFVGYISNSVDSISFEVQGYFPNFVAGSFHEDIYVGADSVSFGFGVNPNNPGNNAVPEPSEWAAMGLLGTGLLGLVVRGRKKKLAI